MVDNLEVGLYYVRILAVDKAGPVVKCHDTALQLLEVKPEGSSQMTGGAFCHGRQIVAGETRFVMI